MTKQYTAGVEQSSINSVVCPTAEDPTIAVPGVLYDYVESLQGPLTNVLAYNPEAGTIKLTIARYSGLDWYTLLTQNTLFEVMIKFRSGDIIIGHNCLLTELPSITAKTPTIELNFKTMDMEVDIASAS